MFGFARALSTITVVALAAGCVMNAPPDAEGHEEALESSGGAEAADRASAVPVHPALAVGTFGFTSLDVGQGDAAVVLAPGGCAAILDAGPTRSGKTIKDYLHALGVTHVDFAIISHFHEDHLGGIDEVEQGGDAIPITTAYDHGGSYASNAYTAYANQFRGRRVTAERGQTFSLCGQVSFKVIATNANGSTTTDENARSVAVKVSYGALDILVGGDLTGSGTDVETQVAADVGSIEVYKVHHHGSAGSSSARFLDMLTPTVSFISVAAMNSYGHPAPATLARLQSAGSAVWQTEHEGTTERGHLELVSSDGHTFNVTQAGHTSTYASKPN